MTAKKQRGYTKELLVLPFDHRGSFQEKMFGIHGKPTPEQTDYIASFKTVVYDGFVESTKRGLPRDKMGVLVDEQFGTEVIRRAKQDHTTLCICVEKSGQEEFDFEYGAQYGAHIDKVNPEIVKVLVRYNPESDVEMNRRQSARLVELSQFLDRTNRVFMFELLVPPTAAQLEQCKGDKKTYDLEMRPTLMIRAIQELQKAGVEGDIWKLEGLDRESDYTKVCEAARAGGRENVGVIVLGRGENEEKVRHWLKVGAQVPGVLGFAVGRTVFWEPLKALKEKKISRDQAVTQIADTYEKLCRLWIDARNA